MATKPTSSLEWATDPGALKAVDSTAENKTHGWNTSDGTINGTPPSPNLQIQNYWNNAVYQWTEYLDAELDEINTREEEDKQREFYTNLRNPVTVNGPASDTMWHTFYSNIINRFIAVGSTNIYHSLDGNSLQNYATGFGTTVTAMAESATTIVAGNFAGDIYTSTDGINYTTRTTPISQQIYGIAYGNGRFIAACISAATHLMKSDDEGATWQLLTNIPNVNFLYGVHYSSIHNRWYVSGTTLSGTDAIFVSDDNGDTFVGKNALSSDARLIEEDENGRIVAVTDDGADITHPIVYSDDGGDTWNQGSIDKSIDTTTGTGAIGFPVYSSLYKAWIAVGASQHLNISFDGIAWKRIAAPYSSQLSDTKPAYNDDLGLFWFGDNSSAGDFIRSL